MTEQLGPVGTNTVRDTNELETIHKTCMTIGSSMDAVKDRLVSMCSRLHGVSTSGQEDTPERATPTGMIPQLAVILDDTKTQINVIEGLLDTLERSI